MGYECDRLWALDPGKPDLPRTEAFLGKRAAHGFNSLTSLRDACASGHGGYISSTLGPKRMLGPYFVEAHLIGVPSG